MGAGVALAQERSACGMGQGSATSPSDLEHGISDLSLAYQAQQPASLTTCAMGYLAAKCGDYKTANLIFDKCIAKGYAGAMIWKAHMYEDGNGVPRDLGKAAELFQRAAQGADEQYAALGKLHYATALYEGKGVAKDEALARQWFEAAAAQGSDDAKEFLRTGHHTASRDAFGHGVGQAPGEVSLSQRLLRKVQAALPTGLPNLQAAALGAALVALLTLGAWFQLRPRRELPR